MRERDLGDLPVQLGVSNLDLTILTDSKIAEVCDVSRKHF